MVNKYVYEYNYIGKHMLLIDKSLNINCFLSSRHQAPLLRGSATVDTLLLGNLLSRTHPESGLRAMPLSILFSSLFYLFIIIYVCCADKNTINFSIFLSAKARICSATSKIWRYIVWKLLEQYHKNLINRVLY